MEGLLSKGLGKYVGGLTCGKDEVDGYIAVSEHLSYIVILNIDMFRALVILGVLRESKASPIITQ